MMDNIITQGSFRFYSHTKQTITNASRHRSSKELLFSVHFTYCTSFHTFQIYSSKPLSLSLSFFVSPFSLFCSSVVVSILSPMTTRKDNDWKDDDEVWTGYNPDLAKKYEEKLLNMSTEEKLARLAVAGNPEENEKPARNRAAEIVSNGNHKAKNKDEEADEFALPATVNDRDDHTAAEHDHFSPQPEPKHMELNEMDRSASQLILSPPPGVVRDRASILIEQVNPETWLECDLQCKNFLIAPKGFTGVFLAIRDHNAPLRQEIARTETISGEEDPKFVEKFKVLAKDCGIERTLHLDVEAYWEPVVESQKPQYFGTASFRMLDVALAPGTRLDIDFIDKHEPDAFVGSLLCTLDKADDLKHGPRVDLKVVFTGSLPKKPLLYLERYIRPQSYGRVHLHDDFKRHGKKVTFDIQNIPLAVLTKGQNSRPFRIGLFDVTKGPKVDLGFIEFSLAMFSNFSKDKLFWWSEGRPQQCVSIVDADTNPTHMKLHLDVEFGRDVLSDSEMGGRGNSMSGRGLSHKLSRKSSGSGGVQIKRRSSITEAVKNIFASPKNLNK